MEHPNSIRLPYCWVCGLRFSDSTPPGPGNKEVHHIIPRQAGGSDGPTVTICDDHHTKLHKIALRLKSKKAYFDLIQGETDTSKHKLLWLATVAFNAFEAVKNDPNKKLYLLMSISKEQQLMIDRLKIVYPHLKSKEAIVSFALQSLYNKHHMKE